MENKIVLYLLGEKGYITLQNILRKYFVDIIEYVVIGRDKNINKDFSIEIEKICKNYKIKYFFQNEKKFSFKGYKMAIGWRWLLEDTDRLIIFHDSLLPKYRGFAPLVNSLINGEKYVGVTALYADTEYDKGKIILQKKIEITYPKKIKEAIKEISELYSELTLEIIKKIKKQDLSLGIEQKEREASYSVWRDEKDYMINWNKKSDEIKRFVDAVGEPYLGAKTFIKNKLAIIEEVEEVLDVNIENREENIGKIIFFLQNKPVVICKKGLLKIVKGYYLENKNNIFPLKNFRIRFSRGGLEND